MCKSFFTVPILLYCLPSSFVKLLICNLRHDKKRLSEKNFVFPSAWQVNLFSCTSPRKNLRRDAVPIYLENRWNFVFPSAWQVNLFSCTSPRKNLRRDAVPIYLENRWNSRVKLRELRLFIPFLILFVASNSTQSKRVSAELVYKSNSGCRWFISLYFTAPECTPWFWSEP